jgi:DNA-binding NtrC family response regulator
MATKSLPKILVVDDEPNVGMIFHRILGEAGYDVLSAANGQECLRTLKKQEPQVVFLDLRMPGMDGVETLRRIRDTHPTLTVVIMTAYQTVTSAVECMKLGAYDYLIKPLDTDRLKTIVKQALNVGEMSKRSPVPASEKAKGAEPEPADMIARGPEMLKIMALIQKVAPTDMTVLILGESGTGKEVTARAIHNLSSRRAGPLVTVDCAALPESLIEAELFGYEKGAFTGADQARAGKFESANGGTLFLDEIGNLPVSVQVKLLRFLQEPTIERLGGRKGPITLNVRILAATNVKLEEAVQRGTFREDLYHRLKVFPVELPPLRSRGPEELEQLVLSYVDVFRRQLNKAELAVSPEASKLLGAYHWPGNIRELQNALRSASLLADNVIQPQHLPMSIQSAAKPAAPKTDAVALTDVLKRVEKEHISNTLKQVQGDLAKAAESLGLDKESLLLKIRNLEIPFP